MSVDVSNFPFSFACDGATHRYQFTSKILLSSDLVVKVRDANDTETVLTENTQYEVTGENGKFESGGYVDTIEYVDGVKTDKDYASGITLIIDRAVPLTQPTEFRTGRKLDLQIHGDSYDRLTMILQDKAALLERALRLPAGDEASVDLPSATIRALKYLFFDADGNPTAAAGVVAEEVTVSAFMETVVAAANAAAVRTLLELVYASIAQAKTGSSTALVINPATLAAVIQSGSMNIAAATGTDTYAADLVPPLAAYAAGGVYAISFTNANLTTSPTLALNGLAARTIKRVNGDAPAAGDIAAGGVALFLYSGGYFYLLTPSGVLSVLVDDCIKANMLADDCVEEDAIKDGAVTEDKIADGSVTGAKLANYTAGDFLLISSDAEIETNNATSYAKKKEFYITRAGVLRIKFDIKQDGYGTTVYGRIYRNGVAVGTEQSNNTARTVPQAMPVESL
jgi:hypothetical protein